MEDKIEDKQINIKNLSFLAFILNIHFKALLLLILLE